MELTQKLWIDFLNHILLQTQKVQGTGMGIIFIPKIAVNHLNGEIIVFNKRDRNIRQKVYRCLLFGHEFLKNE